MGQSFGGTIALEYAKQFPGQVQKLILVDAASDVPDALAAWETELKQREPAQWTAAMIGAQGEALKKALSKMVVPAAWQKHVLRPSGPCISG